MPFDHYCRRSFLPFPLRTENDIRLFAGILPLTWVCILGTSRFGSLDNPLVKKEKIQYNIPVPRKAVNPVAFESSTYSGICKYKDIDFTFICNGEELRLVPPADKKEIIQMDWLLTPLAKGVYTRGNPLTMDEPYPVASL